MEFAASPASVSARSQRRSLTSHVMPTRRLLILLTAAVVVGGVTIWLLARLPHRARRPQSEELKATVLACHRDPGGVEEMVEAETEFQMPASCSLDEPRFEVLIETPSGWRRQDAATMGTASPLDLWPSGWNRATFVLPADTMRWRLLLGGREAGLRERFYSRLSACTGSWARDDRFHIRPIWMWICRRLPNTPGRTLQLKSRPLPVRPERLFKPPQSPGAPGDGGFVSLFQVEHTCLRRA